MGSLLGRRRHPAGCLPGRRAREAREQYGDGEGQYQYGGDRRRGRCGPAAATAVVIGGGQ